MFDLSKLFNLMAEQEQYLQKGQLSPNDSREEILDASFLTKEKELAEYICKLFEQQEREKIVKWIVNSIRESLDLNQVLQNTVEQVGKLLKIDRCLIALFDQETQKFYLASEYRSNLDVPSALNTRLAEELTNKWHDVLIKEKISAIVNDFESPLLNYEQANHLSEYGIKSLAVFPLIHKGVLMGAIIANQVYEKREWDVNHLEILIDIGSQIAIAVKQAQLYSDLKKHSEREALLRKTVNTIRSSLDIDEVLKIICEEVAKIFNVQRATVLEFTNKINFQEWIVKTEYKAHDDIKSMISNVYEKGAGSYLAYNIFNFNKLVIDNLEQCDAPDAFKRTYRQLEVKSLISIPISKEDDRWGGLTLSEIDEYRHWTNEEVNLLTTISDQIYLAIKQAELYSNVKKQAEREKILRKIISAVRSSLDIDETLRIICEEIAQLFSSERVTIIQNTMETNAEEIVRFEYRSREDIQSPLSLSDKNLSNKILNFWNDLINKEKNCITFHNILEGDLPEFVKEIYSRIGVKSLIVLPIKKGEKIWGTLYLSEYSSFRKWLEDDISLLETITDQLYIAIKQAELYSTTRRQAEHENLLRRVITTIRSTLDIDEVLNIVCKEMADIFAVQRIRIGDFTNDIDLSTNLIEYKTDANILGIKDIDPSLYPCVCTYLTKIFIDEGKILAVNNISEFKDSQRVRKAYEQLGVKSLIFVPLKTDEKPWGGIALSDYKKYRNWSDEEILLVETIADQVSIAIRQANLYRESKQAIKLKTEFLANMSHEFRTPLNAIIGFSQMLMSGDYSELNPKQKDYLGNIAVSGEHLLRLINDILDLSKLESGNMELYKEKFDSSESIKEISSVFANLAEKKQIKIETNLSETIITADAGKFRQIMYNLLSNAVKYTKDGGTVTVNSKKTDSFLKVEIIDTGIGISAKDFDQIFNYFRQLDSSYARKQEGTGLGLTLTKKLVEMHGGKIGFTSEEGKGSSFWFVLPIENTLDHQIII
jgi:GAF domain-containing protein